MDLIPAAPCGTDPDFVHQTSRDSESAGKQHEVMDEYSMEAILHRCGRLSKRAFRLIVSRVLRCGPIPDHVAFIMDGNRRWAQKRQLQKHAGHEFGFFQLKECLKWCLDLGIRVVTVYAFSIENFKRSATEVKTLMNLAAEKLDELVEEQGFLHRNGIRIQVLGDLELLPVEVQRAAARAMRISRHHNRAILNICMSYTAREEMLTAVREIENGVKEGVLQPTDVTEDLIASALYTAPYSQVDLLVRTSGETRLSDFMLWQATLSYLSFLPVLWPDFSLLDFAKSILDYQRHYSALCQARAAHETGVCRLQHRIDLEMLKAQMKAEEPVPAPAVGSLECVEQSRLQSSCSFENCVDKIDQGGMQMAEGVVRMCGSYKDGIKQQATCESACDGTMDSMRALRRMRQQEFLTGLQEQRLRFLHRFDDAAAEARETLDVSQPTPLLAATTATLAASAVSSSDGADMKADSARLPHDGNGVPRGGGAGCAGREVVVGGAAGGGKGTGDAAGGWVKVLGSGWIGEAALVCILGAWLLAALRAVPLMLRLRPGIPQHLHLNKWGLLFLGGVACHVISLSSSSSRRWAACYGLWMGAVCLHSCLLFLRRYPAADR